MPIWIDADACPKIIKDILLRASKRTSTVLIFVANKPIPLPSSPLLQMIVVPSGFDVADQKITESVMPGDLIITADVPLAHDVVMKGGVALNPRGFLYTESNVRQALTMRNVSEELRSTGNKTTGPSQYTKQNLQLFANNLDAYLQKKRL